MKLTDRQIQLTKPPHSGRITLTDGNGLRLRITSSDKRTWSLQYRYQGFMRKYTIGSYPGVSLKNARVGNTELRASIQAGHDPQTAKTLARSPSSTNVEECLEEYLRENVQVHGSLFEPKATIEKATGNEVSVDPLLNYLEEKYKDLYGL